MKRILIKVVTITLFVLLIPTLIFGGLFIYTLFRIDANPMGFDWQENLTFELDEHTHIIEFDTSIDILFLTDIHFLNFFDHFTIDLMNETVEKANPDMIILVGDNTFSPWNGEALDLLIQTMDSYELPWTLVFGNHDDFGRHTKNYMSKQLLDSLYSFYQYGPNDFGGAGNQIITFMSNDDIIHNFYLLDTVTTGEVSPPITNNQKAFYQWAVEGMSDYAGNLVPSTLITHVALPEMKDALLTGEILAGSQGEPVSLMTNTGMFTLIKDLGSTINTIHGHDHLNNTSVLYEGITMTYVNQIGMLTYGTRDKKGGTLLTLFQDGTTQLELIYV